MLLQDARFAWRTLWKFRRTTSLALLILALATGAATAVFTVLNAVVLRPLPFRDPDRLVVVWNRFGTPTSKDVWLSMPELRDLRTHASQLDGVSALTDVNLSLTARGATERLRGLAVSASLFPLLGVTPQIGRTFTPADDTPDAPPVVILSHETWTRHFNTTTAIVGQTILLNNRRYEVIGVMPAAFRIAPLSSVMPADVDVWMPLEPHVPAGLRENRTANMLHVLARRRAGVTLTQAQAELTALTQTRAAAFPAAYQRGAWTQIAVPLQEGQTRAVAPILWLLFAATGLVMAVALANVAGLLLEQASARQREIAIKCALGASHRMLGRQFFVEGLLLAAAGTAAGLIIAAWGVDLLSAWAQFSIPLMQDVTLDLRVLAFAIAASALSTLVLGMAPLLQTLRPSLRANLADSHRTAGRARPRARRALVVAQVALSLTLLVATGLVVRSLLLLLRVDAGFTPTNVVSLTIDLPDQENTLARRAAAIDRVTQQLGTGGGVRAVGAISHLPLSGAYLGSTFAADANEAPATLDTFGADLRSISGAYFDAMRLPLLRGRTFTAADTADHTAVAVIDETLARRLWPSSDPIGKRLRWTRTNDLLEIVGVVGGVRHHGLAAAPRETVYRPHTQYGRSTMSFVIHTDAPAETALSTARQTIRGVDPRLAIADSQPLTAFVQRAVGHPQLQARLFALFAALALLLALVGVFGLMSFLVAQRTGEIGLRLALGASRSQILRLVIGQGLGLTLVGLAVGLCLSVAVAPLLRTFLYGISPFDSITYILMSAILLTAAAAACAIPARRAMNVDPATALRHS